MTNDKTSGTVYVVREIVQYEGETLKSIHKTADSAKQHARQLAKGHRYSSDWETFSTDKESHIISISNGDMAFVVTEWEVEE